MGLLLLLQVMEQLLSVWVIREQVRVGELVQLVVGEGLLLQPVSDFGLLFWPELGEDFQFQVRFQRQDGLLLLPVGVDRWFWVRVLVPLVTDDQQTEQQQCSAELGEQRLEPILVFEVLSLGFHVWLPGVSVFPSPNDDWFYIWI